MGIAAAVFYLEAVMGLTMMPMPPPKLPGFIKPHIIWYELPDPYQHDCRDSDLCWYQKEFI